MAIMEPGRVCIVTKGSDAGKEVVVKEVKDRNFVIITGATVKERRANIAHLEPTSKISEVPAGKAIEARTPKAQTPKKPAVTTAKKEGK